MHQPLPDPSPNATAPRVKPEDLEAEIASEHYFTAGQAVRQPQTYSSYAMPSALQSDDSALDLLTICVLVLHNAFTVTGESACASPENFDAQMGRDIARRKAVEKLWPLLGFSLRDLLTREEGLECDAGPSP